MVETASQLVSATAPVTFQSPVALDPSLASPSVYAGETVTVSGSNFGNIQGTGYVQLQQPGVSYGSPSNAYKIDITKWSNDVIQFVAPDGYSGPALPLGPATLQIFAASGLESPAIPLDVVSTPVLPARVSSSSVQPGQWITIIGKGFGATEGSGYVQIVQGQVSYGAPGNWYGVVVKSWTNTAITLQVPQNGTVNGHGEPSLAPGTATLTITTGSGLKTAPITLTVG